MTVAAAATGACRRAAARALRPAVGRESRLAPNGARSPHGRRSHSTAAATTTTTAAAAAAGVSSSSLSSSSFGPPSRPSRRPLSVSSSAERGGADGGAAHDYDPSLSPYDLSHPDCNVTPNIASRVGRNLHLIPGHPLHTVKRVIYDYWTSRPGSKFEVRDDLPPVVSASRNFDSLLIPPDHVSRSKSDTYYLNSDTVLRTHTSAHQTDLLSRGLGQFLVTGDVYRRDEIDSSHYPVFHQTEGVRIFTDEELEAAGVVSTLEDGRAFAERDLKEGLEGMARALFGSDAEMRWVDEYFPFTDPSFELEVRFGDEWMEVLGCGVVHRDIVRNVGRGTSPGWAFGLGLERLAMILFSIPDIRLFWSDDERFRSQFEGGDIDVTFRPYSKYPACYKDISFWTTSSSSSPSSSPSSEAAATDADAAVDAFHENDFYEIVRDVGGDLVEKVELIDDFSHPGTGRNSRCYRVSYRSMDRSLTNEEIDLLQGRVREEAEEKLGVELR